MIYQVIIVLSAKNIRFKTTMARPHLCNYSDPYIVVEAEITVKSDNNANRRNKKLTFKNNNLFRSHIWKIKNPLVDNTEDVDIALLMSNLLEYSGNYSIGIRKIMELS